VNGDKIKIAVTGNRENNFKNPEIGREATYKILSNCGKNIILASGISPKGGVDIWCKEYAKINNIPFIGFPPRECNTRGFRERNINMVTWCNKLIAIFGEYVRYKSGTFYTLRYAVNMHKHVSIYVVDTTKAEIIQLIPKLYLKKEKLKIKEFTIFKKWKIRG